MSRAALCVLSISMAMTVGCNCHNYDPNDYGSSGSDGSSSSSSDSSSSSGGKGGGGGGGGGNSSDGGRGSVPWSSPPITK